MDRNIALAAVVVVFMMLASLSTFLLAGAGEEEGPFDGGLQVFGNADGDDVIDMADVRVIGDVIESADWDPMVHPFADANCDGIVDYEDIRLVRDFLDGKPCTLHMRDCTGREWSSQVNSGGSAAASAEALGVLEKAGIEGVTDAGDPVTDPIGFMKSLESSGAILVIVPCGDSAFVQGILEGNGATVCMVPLCTEYAQGCDMERSLETVRWILDRL